jgi:hypothetical protein
MASPSILVCGTPAVLVEESQRGGAPDQRDRLLESVFDLCLMKLAGMNTADARALVVFNHMTFPLKLDVLGTLFNISQSRYPLGMPRIQYRFESSN